MFGSPSFLACASAIGATMVGVLAPMQVAQACSSCGCNLSADWANFTLSTGPGFKVDLRYDYLNQNQLRRGTGTISSVDASQIVNDGDKQEVEQYTKNNYLTLGLDYSVDANWGVNVQVPYVTRSHSTLGTESDGITPGADGGQYVSKTSRLGDVKVMGRYQGILPSHKLAVQLGLKLPTGSHTQTGSSTDTGNPDPVLVDRGLQVGTGTTDVIVGMSYVDAFAPNWSYLAQGLFQSALNSSDGFRPGHGLNLNLGLSYTAHATYQPQVQINIRHVRHDAGAQADTVSTGGTLVYLSPGVIVPINKQASVYGYAQLPIYQHVDGVQVVPRLTASVGLRYAF